MLITLCINIQILLTLLTRTISEVLGLLLLVCFYVSYFASVSTIDFVQRYMIVKRFDMKMHQLKIIFLWSFSVCNWSLFIFFGKLAHSSSIDNFMLRIYTFWKFSWHLFFCILYAKPHIWFFQQTLIFIFFRALVGEVGVLIRTQNFLNHILMRNHNIFYNRFNVPFLV